jgi:pimeloyl-ACP methyl ester carboxylesterase
MLAHDVVAGAAASTEEGRSDDVVVFAHGILGSKSNWKSFARKLVEAAPQQRALLVDLRNHGASHGFAPPHTVEAAASDVAALCRAQGLRPRVVVGHSWGGKAMLQLALADAAPAGQGVDVAVIVDAPPGRRAFSAAGGVSGKEEIDRVLAAVAAVPLPVTSRKELVTFLKDQGLSEPIAQWMTTNLDAQMRWKFDLAAIPSMLSSFGALDLWPALWAHRPSLVVHTVRGGRSDRWSAAERANVEEAAAKGVIVDHVVDNAGHWVHTDDPQSLLAIVLAALPS